MIFFFFPETCTVEYVLFEAATTLKEAIIREWSLLEKSQIEQLCGFLLQSVTEKLEYELFFVKNTHKSKNAFHAILVII